MITVIIFAIIINKIFALIKITIMIILRCRMNVITLITATVVSAWWIADWVRSLK